MIIKPLEISGSWLIELNKFDDNRGYFFESFRFDLINNSLNRKFDVKQSNTSVSHKGTLRGIHYALNIPSQAKYIQCLQGCIEDFIIDIRVGSPTYGKFISIKLDAQKPQAIFIEEGLAHAFVSLLDNSIVSYNVNQLFNPSNEKGINPFDKTLSIKWPNIDLKLSTKDSNEISLEDAKNQNLLPDYLEMKNYIKSLN
jgi:dTDP-4-dehydrorhamnose 3,5-epimerase